MAKLGLLALSVVAMNTGMNSGNNSLAAAGVVTFAGTTGWIVGEVINRSQEYASKSIKVPDSHIYQPFSVPAKMYLRRWVLLNKPAGCMLQKLALSIETVDGGKDIYEISL